MMFLSKKDQFFLSIATYKRHTFLLLGAKTFFTNQGNKIDSPCIQILARLGKDADVEGLGSLYLGLSINSFLINEYKFKSNNIKLVQYRAYDISYQQLLDFYSLIKGINLTQKEKYSTKTDQLKLSVFMPTEEKDDRIKFECENTNPSTDESIMPVEEQDDCIKFEWEAIDNFKDRDVKTNISIDDEISNSILILNALNTCRTAAILLASKILGFLPNVSSLYFISPGYETVLDNYGRPKPDNFYILPPPPCAYQHVSLEQKKVLDGLYKRLESLPYLNPNSEKTNKKFEALKKIYLELAPKENLSIPHLLASISAFENENKQALFQHRSNDFNFFQSTQTEKLFTKMKRNLASPHFW